MDLTVWVYKLTAKLPAEEKSGLAAAMRKSATAAAQKIADADGRYEDKTAQTQYDAALAALRELQTAGLICRRLGYLGGLDLHGLRSRVRTLSKLIEADLGRCDQACAVDGDPIKIEHYRRDAA